MAERERIPVVCTLQPVEAEAQTQEWADLQPLATSVEPLADGARMVFPATLAARIADLAHRECTCCAFLSMTLTETEEGVTLDIRSGEPEAASVIRHLAGLDQQP